ncbi:TetR/AcrR family transcriptional regulator [Streptomyces pinistramenti]|uniref:TetR/AcrR family transcriptional regulator n=1 Tax=Streptomyces pinistramenti TaxID=2884812 RepID=UPI001D06D3F1|nr:TetR/AcrR family transcriptional regulator [Streptomyces pinistramenti]MCB5911468.1 TetR/AcrR family transcriptional regulator [Streptomyces pinistramenti]
MSTPQARRSNTRQRIQDVALKLFSEHGYEKTSLREIAEKLDVTKAALYYHFKTKEDIVISLFQDLAAPIDDLVAWAEEQPRTLETKNEVLRRYSESLRSAEPLFRFMQENQAAVRDLSIGETFKQRVLSLFALLKEPDAEMIDQVRCLTALFSMHAGMFAMQNVKGDPEEKRKAILEVATELVTAANPPSRRPARPDSAQTESP